MPSSQGAGNGEPGKPRKAAGNGAGRGLTAQNGGRVFPTSPTASSQDIHRTPPHSVEAEQGVLGSMLISPREIIAECVEKINEEYFYVPAHRTIYDVLVELWNAGQAIDLITFTQVLRDRNLLDSVGGAALWQPPMVTLWKKLSAGSEINVPLSVYVPAKVMVVDGVWSSVGSTNFDDRSFRLNDEASLNIYDAAFAAHQVEVGLGAPLDIGGVPIRLVVQPVEHVAMDVDVTQSA